MSMQDDRDEKDISPIDLSRDENDSDPDGKSRTKHLRIHEKLSSPSRIRYSDLLLSFLRSICSLPLDRSAKLFVKLLNDKVCEIHSFVT